MYELHKNSYLIRLIFIIYIDIIVSYKARLYNYFKERMIFMKIKKTVAVLMSALIVLSSLAVGGVTASAATYSTEQLEALCDTYEQRMDGSAYTKVL